MQKALAEIQRFSTMDGTLLLGSLPFSAVKCLLFSGPFVSVPYVAEQWKKITAIISSKSNGN